MHDKKVVLEALMKIGALLENCQFNGGYAKALADSLDFCLKAINELKAELVEEAPKVEPAVEPVAKVGAPSEVVEEAVKVESAEAST